MHAIKIPLSSQLASALALPLHFISFFSNVAYKLSLQTWHMTLYMPSPLTFFFSLLFEPKRDFPFLFTAYTIVHHLLLHQLRSEDSSLQCASANKSFGDNNAVTQTNVVQACFNFKTMQPSTSISFKSSSAPERKLSHHAG